MSRVTALLTVAMALQGCGNPSPVHATVSEGPVASVPGHELDAGMLLFPVRARATPATTIKPEDYAPAILPKDGEATVRFVLDVRTDGWVSGCTVTRSSGSAKLDAATCRVMVARAHFTPAVDARTFAVASRIEQEVTWTPAGPRNIPLPGDRRLRTELSIWEEGSNSVRTIGSYETPIACQAVLARIAQAGAPRGSRTFCFDEPATNYTLLQSKPPPPPEQQPRPKAPRPAHVQQKVTPPPPAHRGSASPPKVVNQGYGMVSNSAPPPAVTVSTPLPYPVNEPIMAIPQHGPGKADLSVWTPGRDDIPTLGRYRSTAECNKAKASLKLRPDQRAYCTLAPDNPPDLRLH